jgi:hypothetical protein
LRNDPDALEQCRIDVKEDIIKFAHVSMEDKARCVDRFAARADLQMRVCGACGIRDPFDTCDKVADFQKITGDHWLRVGKEAYARLKQCPDIDLMRPDANGGYAIISIPRKDLHHVYEVDDNAYHCIPEAVINPPGIRLCKRCARGYSENTVAKRTSEPNSSLIDDFEDLYASNAPQFSIAIGADFGRLSAMRSMGVRVDVSTLERLVLAEARCHQIVYKIVAYGDETDRQRLHGHSIVCPQNAIDHDRDVFGKAALEAAYSALRIVFVGPSGMRQKLEAVALKIEDLRLRPDVIFNFLTINHLLHNGPPVPCIDEVISLIAKHSIDAYIKKHARCVVDTSVDSCTTPSDVANVRSSAQSVQHRADAEDPEADNVSDGEALLPLLAPVGLLEVETQQMDAVLQGIHRVVTEGDGGNADNNIIRPSNTEHHDGPVSPTNARTMRLQRDDNLLNDYAGAADVMYKTWWSLIPLRRGFVKGKSIPNAKWRQVLLFYDNRFAHDSSLLFHAANMVMRHAVNRAVTAKVKTSPGSFEKFKELLHDGSFLDKLVEAREDPKGPVAREVLSRCIGFINLSASKVPWGNRERTGEMAKLIADHRYAGPSSVFISAAPDDVHNPEAIRWAAPYTGDDNFPAIKPTEFKSALQGRDPSERTVLAADGTVAYAMDETSLQLLAAKNPVACAITFYHLIDNVRTNLLGWSSGRKKDDLISAVDPKKARQKGKCYAFIDILIITHPHVIIIPNLRLHLSDQRNFWRSCLHP